MSVRLFFLSLVLALLLSACGRAPETAPTITEPAVSPIASATPETPATSQTVEAEPGAEPTAAPTEASPAGVDAAAQPAPTLAATEPGSPPVVAVEWGARAPLPEANSEIAVAELDGLIYVAGGYPSSRVTVSTVQRYDPAGDSWTLVAGYAHRPKPSRRSRH